MKSHTLALIVVLTSSLSAFAEKGYHEKPDPKGLKTRGEEFLKEAKMWEGLAAEADGKAASDLKKFAKLTEEEGENLVKAGEALEKRQIRVAERYEKKAWDLCAKRGKMMDNVHGHMKSIKVSQEKKGDPALKKEGHEKAATADKKYAASEKEKQHSSEEKKSATDERSSDDAFERLRKEISNLGEE